MLICKSSSSRVQGKKVLIIQTRVFHQGDSVKVKCNISNRGKAV